MLKTRVRDSERMYVLLEMLRSRYDHPTAQDCYLEMRNKIEGIGQSTVYRHLAKLNELGLVKELRPNDGPARYDATTSNHAHFYCTNCRQMVDVHDPKITAHWPGTVHESLILAQGICDKCQNLKS
jgi:Fur family peroxide stress response transcriptional regulator